jgi:Clp amino terminal domain, pathogenicity island component
MFERYTEKARRVIFFARYEASQYGSNEINTEHLLLGLLRENKHLYRWLEKTTPETLRDKIAQSLTRREPLSTGIDLPLSNSAKQVLKFAMREAERLAHKHIGTEHLFLGLLDETSCLSAKLLMEAGATAAQVREHYAEQSEAPKPWSFQRASYRNMGFRFLSTETVEIHGSGWNVDYVRDAVHLCRTYNWHWHKATWMPRDVVIHRKTGRISFELGLASDLANFVLVKKGWKKDHCFICHWEIFESQNDSEHGTGYTNGHDWLCLECYAKFWERPDFFSSSYSDIT